MPETPGSRDGDRRAIRWIVVLLLLATALTLSALWVPLVLAAWFAHVADPLVSRLTRLLGGRRRIAAWIVVLALLVILVPISAIGISLISVATDFIGRALESPEWGEAFRSIVSGGGRTVALSDFLDPQRVVEVLREHGAVAVGFLRDFFGATSAAVVGIFVFFLAGQAFAHDGARQWRWVVEHAPLDARHLERLRVAFNQVGRGLIFGIGLTALVQATVGTIIYFALAVPRALLLGALTFFAAFIPSIGTGLVWVPVAAGLALAGHPIKALVLAGLGVLVIGTIDNLLGPYFQRRGNLDLPLFVLILSIFGGFVVFGAWGFVLGPLIIRLTREAMDIAREERLFAGG